MIKCSSCNTWLLLGIQLVTILIVSCQVKKSGGYNQDSIEALVKDNLGNPFEEISNVNNELVLYYSTSSSAENRSTRFIVVDIAKEEIIYKSSVDKGTVDWFDDRRLAVFSVPGTMRAGQTRDDYTFIIDVYSGEKVRKSELTK